MQVFLSHQTLWNFSTKTFIKLASDFFDGVEFVDEPQGHSWSLREELDEIKDCLSSSGLSSTLHGSYRDLNLASFSPLVRDCSVNSILGSLDIARDMEIGIVTIHPGKVSGKKHLREDSLLMLKESLAVLLKRAEDYGIVLSVENMYSPSGLELCQTPTELLSVVDGFDPEYLGVTVDFSHLSSLSVNSRKFVEEVSHRLCNVHISDSLGLTDHLPFGSGIINLQEIFEVLESVSYSGACVLEGFYMQDPLKGLMASKKSLLDVIRKMNSR